MPGFFKSNRRRTNAGPNKNEKKVLRGQKTERLARSVGLIKERFPSIKSLSVQLEFITPQRDIYERQSRLFGPDDVCDFSAACPGRCGGQGTFDVAAKVRTLVETRQTHTEGTGICREPLYAGSSDVCGFQLHCRVEAVYAAEQVV